MLPEGWKETTLGKCVKIYSGYAPQIVDPKDDGTYPYVKVDDLNNCDKYQKNSKQYFFDEKYCIPLMSVIFPKRGAAIMNNKVRIAATHIGLDTNMMAVYPISSVCHTEFIYYFIKYSGLYRIADISSIPQINNKHILPYKINLPPLSEQKKIAAILSTWDKAISTADAMLENSRQQKKALMQQLLTGKRRLPGFSGYWKKYTFQDIFNIEIGATPSRNKVSYWDLTNSRKNPWATISDLKGKYIDKTKEYITNAGIENSNVSLAASGTILMSFKLTIGKVSIANIPMYFNEAICALFTKEYFIITSYAYHMLLAYDFLQYTDHAVKGRLLNKSKLNCLDTKIPPLDEQRAIAAVLDAADREIALLEQKAARLREEKKALMQQLLTGKRRVKI